MLKCLEYINWEKTSTFAAGAASGTAGTRILSSRDAEKVYINYTAAVLRAKECVMKIVSIVQENAEDIHVNAKAINEGRVTTEEVAESDSLNDAMEETLYETLNGAEVAIE